MTQNFINQPPLSEKELMQETEIGKFSGNVQRKIETPECFHRSHSFQIPLDNR